MAGVCVAPSVEFAYESRGLVSDSEVESVSCITTETVALEELARRRFWGGLEDSVTEMVSPSDSESETWVRLVLSAFFLEDAGVELEAVTASRVAREGHQRHYMILHYTSIVKKKG